MIRPRDTSWIARLATLTLAALTLGDDALLRDGSMQPLDPAALAAVGDATWPGWVALRRTQQVREEDLSPSVIALDDGQRIGGGFQAVGNGLWWNSRPLGTMQVDLERVAWIGPPSLGDRAPAARDQVALVNGDRVEGFVSALEAERGVEVETSVGGGEATRTWYDLARVASIRLTPRPRAATGWRLWLRDGSVVDVDGWQRDGGRVNLQGLHLAGTAPRVSVAWDDVLGVQRAGETVVPIAGLAWKAGETSETVRLAPAEARVDARQAVLGVRSIDLHGPGAFVARVPDGRWLLDLSLVSPPALAGRVGCTVQVLAGDRELARTRIEGATKPVALRARIEGGDLRVVISDPAHGPFGAAVRLDGALLLPVTADGAPASPEGSSAPASAPPAPDPG